jgi:hypothetical protein
MHATAEHEDAPSGPVAEHDTASVTIDSGASKAGDVREWNCVAGAHTVCYTAEAGSQDDGEVDRSLTGGTLQSSERVGHGGSAERS